MRSRASGWVAATAMALATGACGTTSTTTVGPTPVKCDVTLMASGSVASSTGTAVIGVDTPPECSWTASTSSPWLTKLTPASGQGPGQIQVDVAANPAAVPRDGEVVVNEAHVVFHQEPSPCVYTVTPAGATVPATAVGGVVAFTVATLTGCNWTAVTAAPWLSVSSGSPGSGSGAASVTVAANSGPARQAGLTVAGVQYTVTQASGCRFLSMTPAIAHFGIAGGQGLVASTTSSPDCTWTAASDVPWITILAVDSATGTVVYLVGPWGSFRDGTIRITGDTSSISHYVSQN